MKVESQPVRAVVWVPAERERAAARSRSLVRRVLREWGVGGEDADDVVLMVDELVTNAVVHGGGPVRLRLLLVGDRVVGEVGDGGPVGPLRGADPGGPGGPDWSESGRGLLLVGALAAEFGVRAEPVGKTVWFARPLVGGRAGPSAR